MVEHHENAHEHKTAGGEVVGFVAEVEDLPKGVLEVESATLRMNSDV